LKVTIINSLDRELLVEFEVGENAVESCYIPKECVQLVKIKQNNNIIILQKGKEMKTDKIELLKNERDVTNKMMIECDLVGIHNEQEHYVNVVKNAMNGVTGKIPESMWDSLAMDYIELLMKAEEKAYEKVQKIEDEAEEKVYDEVFEALNEFLSDLSKQPEIKKATTKINDLFEGVAKSLDEIRPDTLVEDVQESLGERGNLKSFLESIEKTVNEVYGTAQEKAQEVKETVKTKADNVAERALNSYERAQLEIRRDKLIAFQQEAGELGVQTKGFNKKIQKKIDSINKILG